MVWAVGNDGSPVFETRRSLLQKGKRIIFENQKEIWLTLEDGVVPVVMAPVMWTAHQFDDNNLQEYPNCTSRYLPPSLLPLTVLQSKVTLIGTARRWSEHCLRMESLKLRLVVVRTSSRQTISTPMT
jgi:hypothetical protein